MVIIEANVRGAERITTFQSKDTAFYFLKSISFWASVESIATTSVRTKIKVKSYRFLLFSS
ncbi:hypothetical protein [Haemophilus parahaemolyticus]|uniref:hypothetical protein n=1 Tax=Haemophilus parahaemolyticus TaxID=735 RepID=UPI00288B0060|nr:hypothetical protein [Haemophilus parahaemolyticus]